MPGYVEDHVAKEQELTAEAEWEARQTIIGLARDNWIADHPRLQREPTAEQDVAYDFASINWGEREYAVIAQTHPERTDVERLAYYREFLADSETQRLQEVQAEAREDLLSLMRDKHSARIFAGDPQMSDASRVALYDSIEDHAEYDYKRYAEQHPGMAADELLAAYRAERTTELAPVQNLPSKRSEMVTSPALAAAIEAGAQKGRERITELTPQSLEDLRSAAKVELRNAQGFATLAYADKTGESESQQRAYRIGMRLVVSAWYREQKPIMQIASGLGEYAAQQAPLPYVNAEAAIAQNFLAQLTSGRKTIDLSQRYATEDQSAAQARHEKALENLRPLMRETSRLQGYKVMRGAAIADGLTQREVLALRHEQKQSLGNV